MEVIRRRKNFKSKTTILFNSIKDNKNIKESLNQKNKDKIKNVIAPNNNKSNSNRNNSESLEMIIKEEIERVKLSFKKKENLKNIDLIEKNVSDLYKWKALFNHSIPLKKYISPKSNLNQEENNKENEIIKILNEFKHNKTLEKANSSKNIDNVNNKDTKKSLNNLNIIDYYKGINVISKIPNESMNNFYEKIIQKRKEAPELGPRLKMKNKHLQNGIKTQRVLSFNKEIQLNILLSNEMENKNFSNEDLIIAAKRKNADILIRPYLENDYISKKFKTMNSFNKTEYRKNMFRKGNNKNKKGLILSVYDENNPYIQKFNEYIYSLSEQNNKKTEKEEDEIIKPTLKRNIFSAHNLNLKNLDINNENEKNNREHSSVRNKSSRNENKIKSIPIFNDFFKNGISKNDKNFMTVFNESKNKKILERPMSSSNLETKIYQKFGLVTLHFNENSMPPPKQLNYIPSFPKKMSSKVGNIIFDKINKMIKSKADRKIFLTNSPHYLTIDKNITSNKKVNKLLSKNINNDYENSEESKNNKLTPTHKYEDLKNKLNKNKIVFDDLDNKTNYYFFADDYNVSKNLKNELCKYPLTIHNKLGNLYYSCSNNQIINNKRKKKSEYLSHFDEVQPLNEVLADILNEDKNS